MVYVCTDYRLQGQTISAALIDTTPPSGSLNAFNLHIALSHAKGCDSIRLLRDLEDRLVLSPQLPKLTAEGERLELLNMQTPSLVEHYDRQ